MSLRAVTFDFWDTLYTGASLRERADVRRAAVGRLLAAHGHHLDPDSLATLYHEASRESERIWREEHRGYTTADRLTWMLARLGTTPPDGCEHVSECVRAVDQALLDIPAPLIPGAAEGIRALAARVPLAIVSDTGFASGEAQNRLLAQDGLLDCFAATVYSCDVGHAKPHRAMFAAAAEALGVAPGDVLHVGDNERTDVAGALAYGMRAARVDFVKESGESKAELVARTFEQLHEHLLREIG